MKLDLLSIKNVNKNAFLGTYSVLRGWAPRVNYVICSGRQLGAVEASLMWRKTAHEPGSGPPWRLGLDLPHSATHYSSPLLQFHVAENALKRSSFHTLVAHFSYTDQLGLLLEISLLSPQITKQKYPTLPEPTPQD